MTRQEFKCVTWIGVTQGRNHGLKVGRGRGSPKFFFRPRECKEREEAQVIIGAATFFFVIYPITILIVVTNKNALVLEAIQIF